MCVTGWGPGAIDPNGGRDIGFIDTGAGAQGFNGFLGDMAHEYAADGTQGGTWLPGYNGDGADYGVGPAGGSGAQMIYFVGTGFAIKVSSSSATAYRFIVDGVELGTFTAEAQKDTWVDIVSDLAEGSHTIQFENDSSAQIAFLSFRSYRTKRAASVADARDGNLIADMWKTADFAYCNLSAGLSKQQLCMSRGTLMQSFLTHAGLYGGWAGTAYTAKRHTDQTQMMFEYSAATTGDKLQRWFFGTGFDLPFYSYSGGGIASVKVDGNLVTTANFPSMVENDIAAVFDSSTGMLDTYGASPHMEKFGVAGLFATKGWHLLELEVTGTKNPSSSGYGLLLYGMHVHGADYDFRDVGGIHANHMLYRGACRDVRVFDGVKQLEFGEARYYQRRGLVSAPATAVAAFTKLYVEDMHIVAETKEGENLEIEFWSTIANSAAGTNTYIVVWIDHRLIDTFSDVKSVVTAPGSNYAFVQTAKWTVPVAKGYHVVRVSWYKSSAGTITALGQQRVLTVKPVPAFGGV